MRHLLAVHVNQDLLWNTSIHVVPGQEMNGHVLKDGKIRNANGLMDKIWENVNVVF